MALLCRALGLLLVLIFLTNVAAEDSDDFVPDFFGGRRNEDGNSGMGPPHQSRPKTRSGPNVLVRTLNFTQRLDHFDKCNRRVWNQRYMVNDAYFQPRPDGPIFIRIGGEAEIFEDDVQDGPLIRLAKEHKALVLSMEHRFYGESKPTSDLKTKNLKYLSSKQALADLEAFISSIRTQYEVSNPNAKVVLYGCSYAGSLATFHRRLYSNSTAGAIAGFAPIFAVASFNGYFSAFFGIIEDENQVCGKQTEHAIRQIVCLALNTSDSEAGNVSCEDCDAYSPSEREAMLHDAIDVCDPKVVDLADPHAISSMMYDLLSRLMYMAQYNKKNSDGSSPLRTYCRYMTDSSKGQQAIARYGAWRKEVEGRCVVHHGRSIQTRSSDWSSDYAKAGTRQWLYQMCSEFGWFVADDLLRLSYYTQTCDRSFNIVDLEENVDRTNELYGGEEGMNSTNMYFLSSVVDPWYAANKLDGEEDSDEPIRDPTVRIKVLRGISHCHEPMGDCSEEKELVDAWNDINDQVSRWIGGKPREGPGIFTKCAR